MKKLFLLLALCAFLTPAYGQLAVNLNIKRRMHLLYEPVLATVTVTNNSGRDIMLDESEAGPWFSFAIVKDGRTIPARNPDYTVAPLPLRAGETMKRTVNLTELYALADYGTHKVRANVYFSPISKYFSSNNELIELAEGTSVWKQTVGVPNGEIDSARTFSLVTLDHDDGRYLYARIVGQDDGVIYGCYKLGKLVDGTKPETQFDNGNNLWILQLVGQRTYLLTQLGVTGEFLAQNTYVTPKSKPYLRKLADGTLQIVGAVRENRVAEQQTGPLPKLSDRPPGLR